MRNKDLGAVSDTLKLPDLRKREGNRTKSKIAGTSGRGLEVISPPTTKRLIKTMRLAVKEGVVRQTTRLFEMRVLLIYITTKLLQSASRLGVRLKT